MVTKNIKTLEELDSYWTSKYQKLKNTHSKKITGLLLKLNKMHTRARVDYKIIEKLRTKNIELHNQIYKELALEGINTRGIVHKESKKIVEEHRQE